MTISRGYVCAVVFHDARRELCECNYLRACVAQRFQIWKFIMRTRKRNLAAGIRCMAVEKGGVVTRPFQIEKSGMERRSLM